MRRFPGLSGHEILGDDPCFGGLVGGEVGVGQAAVERPAAFEIEIPLNMGVEFAEQLGAYAETGAAVIQMTPGLDAGPILGEVRTPISPDETSGELEERLSRLGAAGSVGVSPSCRASAAPATRLEIRVSATRKFFMASL